MDQEWMGGLDWMTRAWMTINRIDWDRLGSNWDNIVPIIDK